MNGILTFGELEFEMLKWLSQIQDISQLIKFWNNVLATL